MTTEEYKADALIKTIKNNDPNSLYELIKNPLSYDHNYVDIHGNNALFCSIKFNFNGLSTYLISTEGLCHTKHINNDGNTTLMFLLKKETVKGRLFLAHLLLNKVDLLQRNQLGETTLYLACNYLHDISEQVKYQLPALRFIQTLIKLLQREPSYFKMEGCGSLKLLVSTYIIESNKTLWIDIIKDLVNSIKKDLFLGKIDLNIISEIRDVSVIEFLLKEQILEDIVPARDEKIYLRKFIARWDMSHVLFWLKKYQITDEKIIENLWVAIHKYINIHNFEEEILEIMLKNYIRPYLEKPINGITFLMMMTHIKKPYVIEFLESEYANIDYIRPLYDTTPFYNACMHSNEELALAILEKCPDHYDLKAKQGIHANLTPYDIAVQKGLLKVILKIDELRLKDKPVAIIAKVDLECIVCISKMDLEIALSPCGHVNIHDSCYQMSKKSLNGKCPICRQHVIKVLKLYGG